MKEIANLLFEARMLKEIPRTGYQFLGAGRETVAEHSFITAFIGLLLGEEEPRADPRKLMTMCLIHDLAEARIGDLNYVQKRYVTPDEEKALEESVGHHAFGERFAELIREFNAGETVEARLARDADQLSLIADLKALSDIGHSPPDKWLPHVRERLVTEAGKKLADAVMETGWDEWWLKKMFDIPKAN